jgi:hypothetical protein
MWLGQALILGTLAAVACLLNGSLERANASATATLAVTSLLLFSPAEHQNWLWGFQVCFQLPAACLLAMLLFTHSRKFGPGWSLAVSGALSTVGTFSILPGLLTWPLGAAAVAFVHGMPTKTTGKAWLCWLAAFAIVVGAYFYGYVHPPNTPSATATLLRPYELAIGIAICAGAPFAVGDHALLSAGVIGFAGLAAFGWTLTVLWRHRNDFGLMARAWPWIIMGFFGVLSAAAIAVGRTGYGFDALMESRYAAMTVWIYVAPIVLTTILRDWRDVDRPFMRTSTLMLAAAFVAYGTSLPRHIEATRNNFQERLQSRAVYTFFTTAPTGLPMVPPWLDWDHIKYLLTEIEKEGWRANLSHHVEWRTADNPCSVGSVEFLTLEDRHVMASGWAYLTHDMRPADAVLVTTGSPPRVLFLQRPLIGRTDIVARSGTERAQVVGWTMDARLIEDAQTLSFWAFDAEALTGYRLCASFSD